MASSTPSPSLPPYKPIVSMLTEALGALDRSLSPDGAAISAFGGPDLVALRALVRGALVFAESGGGIGECRQDTPFSPLRPVLDSHGHFKWCCNHKPEHCSPGGPV